jgi:hypothetical protein
MPAPAPASYLDFVIHGRRKSSSSVQLGVSSPAGGLAPPVTVRFSEAEARELREAFHSGMSLSGLGHQRAAAAAGGAGGRLARVLFPPPVFKLLAQCLGQVVRGSYQGLRIRLALDASLSDLPWEYVHRPDRPDAEGVSGFLLLDPTISMVRRTADPLVTLEPLAGRQRLAFVGAMWERGQDRWEVVYEFERLRAALAPISRYVVPEFTPADQAFDRGVQHEAAIIHYGGHCDFDGNGDPFLVLEMPESGDLRGARKFYLRDLAESLRGGPVRLVVLNACNGGHPSVVQPLLDAGVPAIIGINGQVLSRTAIEFCAKLYESLAVGLTLDEAVGRARLHVLEWDLPQQLFDWGLFMVYMPSAQAVLCPRRRTAAVGLRQRRAQKDHLKAARAAREGARELDGMNFAEIMSELTRRRVLILGRFTGRRLKVLEAIKAHLARHPQGYQPELFTSRKPEARDLVESIVGFASLSRFIIADLSEARSIQSELQAIVPQFPSVPVAPVINQTGKAYATFDTILRRENVLRPIRRYRDLEDLLAKLDRTILPEVEAKLARMGEAGER